MIIWQLVVEVLRGCQLLTAGGVEGGAGEVVYQRGDLRPAGGSGHSLVAPPVVQAAAGGGQYGC